MKDTKLKSGFKECPKCHKKTCSVYVQNETETEAAEASETCLSCGYSKVIYDQYAEITKQMEFKSNESKEVKKLLRKNYLTKKKRDERQAKKDSGLVLLKETWVTPEQKTIIENIGIENIMKIYCSSIK